jgi:hypothetical protein
VLFIDERGIGIIRTEFYKYTVPTLAGNHLQGCRVTGKTCFEDKFFPKK